jgi:hypothetical protein
LATFAVKAGARIVEGLTDMTLRHTNKDGERDTEGAVLVIAGADRRSDGVRQLGLDARASHVDTFDGTTQVPGPHNETHRTDTSPVTLFTTDTTGERRVQPPAPCGS